MKSSRASLLAQQYYQQIALESADYYMLELATTGMPSRRIHRTKITQKSSPTMSSLQDRVELIQQRVANLKKQRVTGISA